MGIIFTETTTAAGTTEKGTTAAGTTAKGTTAPGTTVAGTTQAPQTTTTKGMPFYKNTYSLSLVLAVTRIQNLFSSIHSDLHPCFSCL